MRSHKAGNNDSSLKNKIFAMDVSKLSDKKLFEKYYALQREKEQIEYYQTHPYAALGF